MWLDKLQKMVFFPSTRPFEGWKWVNIDDLCKQVSMSPREIFERWFGLSKEVLNLPLWNGNQKSPVQARLCLDLVIGVLCFVDGASAKASEVPEEEYRTWYVPFPWAEGIVRYSRIGMRGVRICVSKELPACSLSEFFNKKYQVWYYAVPDFVELPKEAHEIRDLTKIP